MTRPRQKAPRAQRKPQERATPPGPTFTPGHRKPGRPTLLTPVIEDRFLGALQAGNTYTDAARACGLNPITVEKWLKRGRGHDPHRVPTHEYVRFARMAEEAKATAKVMVVGNVVARSRVDVEAAKVWLAHEDPTWRPAALRGDVDEPPALPSPIAPADAKNVTPINVEHQENTQTNVIVIEGGQVPEFIRDLLARKRAARPVEPEPVLLTERNDGPSSLRDNGLRID